jgi:hypothetical protein
MALSSIVRENSPNPRGAPQDSPYALRRKSLSKRLSSPQPPAFNAKLVALGRANYESLRPHAETIQKKLSGPNDKFVTLGNPAQPKSVHVARVFSSAAFAFVDSSADFSVRFQLGERCSVSLSPRRKRSVCEHQEPWPTRLVCSQVVFVAV